MSLPDPPSSASPEPPVAPEPPSPTPKPRSGWASLVDAFPSEFRADSYPNTGPLAVGARVLFLVVAAVVVLAALGPHQFKPRIVGHYHLQRFAAWYVLSGMAAAALPRARLRWLGLSLIVFAVLAELVRAMPQPISEALRENVYADIGGVYALLFPLALARWRLAVRPRIARAP